MLKVNGFENNTFYVKKRIKSEILKLTPNVIEDDTLSLQSIPIERIESIAEEKTCTVLESEGSQNRRRSKEFSQGTIDRIREYGETENFRAIVKGLLKKRGEIKVTQGGQFKPELYNRDFHYYFNSNKFIIMVKRIVTPKTRSKAMPNILNISKIIKGPSKCEQSFDKISCITYNLNTTLKTKKNASANISKILTKIPSKVVKGESKRLDLAFNKAKDAARVVRRLEYSYNMKMNMIHSNKEHKKYAQIIQKWWRKIIESRRKGPYAKKIQKRFRGMLTRTAFRQTLVFIQYLPFISALHHKFYDKLPQIGFDEILFRHGIKTINTAILPSTNLLLKRIKKFLASRAGIIRKVYHIKCNLRKFVYDIKKATLLQRLQGRIKIYLMKNNDRIMFYHAGLTHPHFYFLLKYGVDKAKPKIVSFRRCFQRFQQLHLKVNKGIENRFELVPYLMRKRYWNLFQEYNEEAKNRDNNRPIKKRLIRKTLYKNDKKIIRKAFFFWKRYNKVYFKFIKPHQNSKLTMLTQILQSKKNLLSTLFLNKIKRKSYNRPTKKEAIKTIADIKNSITPLVAIYLNKYFQDWRHKARKAVILKSSRKINRFFRNTQNKYKLLKGIKVFFLNGLIKHATFYRKSMEIQKKLILKTSIYRLVYTKIRSIGFKEKMQLLFKHLLQPAKSRFNQWAFENKKYNHSIVDYIQLLKRKNLCKNRKSKLISVYYHLKHRLQQHFLRRAFIKFRVDSGVYYRHINCSNFRLLFLHKAKKSMSSKRYRLLRYTVNKITRDQEDLRLNSKLIDKWDLWKKAITPFKIKKILKRGVKKIIKYQFLLARRTFLKWKKTYESLNASEKTENNQINIKTYIQNKRVKDNE